MKKNLFLPFLTVAALVSQAWADTWTACPAPNNGYCKWNNTNTGCSQISSCTGGATDSDCAKNDKPCADMYKNCLDNSPSNSVYSDAACTTVKEEGSIKACGDWCDWGTGGCYEIKTNPTGANNSATTTTCDEAKAACDKDGVRWSGASCTGTQLGGVRCNKWCKWPTGCTEIKPDPTGTTPTTTCEQAIANCSTNGKLFDTQAACNSSTPSSSSGGGNSSSSGGGNSSSSGGGNSSSDGGGSSSSSGGGNSSSDGGGSSSSSGGTEPIIISHNNAPVSGLNVTHFARSLQIASGKDATVALFDMRGKKVLSQSVLSGTTTISLQKQRQGIYYAVVKSGSQKKTVKVVLK